MPHTRWNRFNLYMHGYRSAYQMAECYQHGKHVKKDINIAIMLYEKAVKKGNFNAYSRLGELYLQQEKVDLAIKAFTEGTIRANQIAKSHLIELAAREPAAKYHLGIVYEHEGKLENASKCFSEVAASNSPIWSSYAIDVLVRMAKTKPQAAFYLARMYELNQGGLKNSNRMLEYYVQSSRLGDKRASFHLGELFEMGAAGVSKDLEKAWQYYLIAARKYSKGIEKLEKLVGELKDSPMECEYQLGKFYFEQKNIPAALGHYKRAADRQSSLALRELSRIAAHDHKNAYMLAVLYHENEAEAFHYRAFAMRKGHRQAEKELVSAARAGNPNAQYALGYDYCHFKRRQKFAVIWCMKAAKQGHEKSVKYILSLDTSQLTDRSICAELAKMHETGHGIPQNMACAFKWYARASDLNDRDAAFSLGQLYQVDYKDQQADDKKACQYYMRAAKLGHEEALIPLSRLAEGSSTQVQRELGDLYQQRGDASEAKRWYAKATEGDYSERKTSHAVKQRAGVAPSF